MTDERQPDVASRTVAIWRGKEYFVDWSPWNRGRVVVRTPRGADTPPEFEQLEDGSTGKEISPGELDEWYDSEWYFAWRGKTFQADKIENDMITGTMVDADQHFAENNGLTTVDRAWHLGTFPLNEVRDLREERSDRLEQWRSDRQLQPPD